MLRLSLNSFAVTFTCSMSNDGAIVRLGQVVGVEHPRLIIGSPTLFRSNVGCLSLTSLGSSLICMSSTFYSVHNTDLSTVGLCDRANDCVSNAIGTVYGSPYILGVAENSGSAGQYVTITTAGITRALTDLTAGNWYFAQPNGSITSSFTPMRVGYAVSSTELLLLVSKTF